MILAKPRQIFNANEKSRPKTPWTFENSFFARFKHDNDLLMQRCFEFDWKSGVFDRIIKNDTDREVVKNYLRYKYKYIRECYKHLASVSPAGNVPSVGMNPFSELMLKAKDFVDY